MIQSMDEEYYTVEEVAGKIGVTSRTIRNYLKQGKLKGRKIGGRWRFSSEDIESFLSNQSNNFESIEDPIELFISNRNLTKGEARTLFVLDFENTDFNIESIKERTLNEYNNVYQGIGRELFYRRISPTTASIVLIGNPLYVTRFSSWISDMISEI